jgi:hypothetical protein
LRSPGDGGGRELWAVDVTRQPALSVSAPRRLFAGRYTSLGGLTNYDVSLDGQRFLMLERDASNEPPVRRLRVVLDWLPAMRPLPGGSGRL